VFFDRLNFRLQLAQIRFHFRKSLVACSEATVKSMFPVMALMMMPLFMAVVVMMVVTLIPFATAITVVFAGMLPAATVF